MAKKSAASGNSVTAFEVLIDSSAIEPAAVCVIVGDDGFLVHEARRAVVRRLAEDDEDAAVDVLDGDIAEMRDVLDGLSELSLFGGERRMVAVESADALVKNHRQRLEDYVAKPVAGSTLILEVKSWPSNTRLAKAVAASGLTIECQRPAKGAGATKFDRQLKEWLALAARRELDVELEKNAAEVLLDLLPTAPGVLLQEVARLALLAGRGGKITAALVREHVGGWRTRQTWDMVDAAADGRAGDALVQLDRLLAAGEDPHGLFPQMASSLRKFALACRLIEQAEGRRQRLPLQAALKEAGVWPFKLNDAERQLKQLGRQRARQLYRWLLATDLELKGHNSSKERARRALETFIVRLSSEGQVDAGPAKAGVARR